MKHEELGKLQRQYDRLTKDEKIRRLEILLDYHLQQTTRDCKFVVDATKHWLQFEEMAKQSKAIESGAVTMAEVMR